MPQNPNRRFPTPENAARLKAARYEVARRLLEDLALPLGPAQAKASPEAVLFAGDDVTDEHGFAVLRDGDIGVKVGEGQTQAAYRIPEPRSLAEVLGRIAELRNTR